MKRQSIWGISLLVILLGAFSSLYIYRTKPLSRTEMSKSQGIPVTTHTVTTGEIAIYQNYSGNLQSGEEAKITPQALASVIGLYVQEGDTVTKGDALMDLDTTQLNNQIQSAKEAIEKLKAFNANLSDGSEKTEEIIRKLNEQIETLEEHLDKLYGAQSSMYAGATYTKEITALEGELESLKMLKQTLLTLNTSTPSSDDKLDTLEASYQTLVALKNQYHIVAPINGHVSAVNIKVGEKPNFLVPSLIVTSTDTLKLNLYVPKLHLTYFQNTSLLEVEVISPTGVPTYLKGKVQQVDETADVKIELYPVQLILSNPDHVALSGSFGKVQLPLQTKESALIIPKDALIRTSDAAYIYILNTKEHTAIRRDVTTGIENDDTIEILEGLAVDESIILDGNTYIQSGDTVQVVPPLG
ncbi:MAG: efflux RND transporter periplasmic adaptor subunit [Niameybacter sp.]